MTPLQRLRAVAAGLPTDGWVTVSVAWLRELLGEGPIPSDKVGSDITEYLGQYRARAVTVAAVEYVEWMRRLSNPPPYPGTPWARLCRAVDRMKTAEELTRAERSRRGGEGE